MIVGAAVAETRLVERAGSIVAVVAETATGKFQQKMDVMR